MKKRIEIIHKPCGKSVEKCLCKKAEVSVVHDARSSSNIERDVLKALRKARRTIRFEPDLLATEHSAGFILPPKFLVKKHRVGWQVTVRLIRFDERLLEIFPETGGQLIEANAKQIQKLNNSFGKSRKQRR
jgi:hypothetical protein